MDNEIYEYIKNGITIDGNPIDGYKVFTIPTQHFKIDNLDELTKWTFENEIRKQKEHDELTSEIFKEVQNEIDQEILNQLRGGEPNPDIIPMNTIDRLYNNFINNPDYKAESVADLMGSQAGQLVKCSNKFEFIDKLLFDDDFYQKWGDDCCEEISRDERIKMYYDTYAPGIKMMDNHWMDAKLKTREIPKRKLKWN
jgi:hypothetical protein